MKTYILKFSTAHRINCIPPFKHTLFLAFDVIVIQFLEFFKLLNTNLASKFSIFEYV